MFFDRIMPTTECRRNYINGKSLLFLSTIETDLRNISGAKTGGKVVRELDINTTDSKMLLHRSFTCY